MSLVRSRPNARIPPREDTAHSHRPNDRVRVRDGKITGVELTPAANAHYAALAMPEYVTVARPEGFEPPTY